jgi:hypothetical protein
MDRAARFRALPTPKKLLVYASAACIIAAVIAWLALIQVTLSKAFQAASPWETAGIFVVVTLTLVVFYRACGLHRY